MCHEKDMSGVMKEGGGMICRLEMVEFIVQSLDFRVCIKDGEIMLCMLLRVLMGRRAMMTHQFMSRQYFFFQRESSNFIL